MLNREQSFYPWHDLANLASLPPFFIFLIISTVFLFAYSLIFCFTVLIHFLANNFAHGINFVRVRAALVPTLRWPFSLVMTVINLRWERICSCLAISSAICAFLFLTQLVFYLVHTCFTLLVREKRSRIEGMMFLHAYDLGVIKPNPCGRILLEAKIPFRCFAPLPFSNPPPRCSSASST